MARLDAQVMSKADIREIVSLRIDFIVQNTSSSTTQCHFDDGWGPSAKDPQGQEGVCQVVMSV